MKQLTDYQNIVLALVTMKNLTTFTATVKVGTTKLPTRVGEIERTYGVRFKREWDKNDSAKKKFLRYSLNKRDLNYLLKAMNLK